MLSTKKRKNGAGKAEGKKLAEVIHGLNYGKSITVGDFTIYDRGVGAGSFWISRDDGSSGDFSRKDFLKVVTKFYADNF